MSTTRTDATTSQGNTNTQRPESPAGGKKRAAAGKAKQRSQVSSEGRPPLKAKPVVEALRSLNGDNVIILRSTTSMQMEVVKQPDALELRAAFHEMNWTQRQVISRSLADVVAASCGVPESDLKVCEAIQFSATEGYPVFRIELPEPAAELLAKPEAAEELQRTLNFLADGHLTSLSGEEFAKEKNVAPSVVAALKKTRAALPSRKLNVDLQAIFRAWKRPVVFPGDLCEPEAPRKEKRAEMIEGRFSGFDLDDRVAHFRQYGKASRLDLSFDEQRWFEHIYNLCARRTIVRVSVTAYLEDGRTVAHEIDGIEVIQDTLI